jgi:hypothetical protein
MEISDKPLVLLVDDNEPTCTLVTALLQEDFEAEVATDGREAVAINDVNLERFQIWRRGNCAAVCTARRNPSSKSTAETGRLYRKPCISAHSSRCRNPS